MAQFSTYYKCMSRASNSQMKTELTDYNNVFKS